MKNLVYGIVGFGLEIAQSINAIGMINNKEYTTEQNQTFAACAVVGGVFAGIFLGISIQKAYDEEKAKKEAKKQK